MLEPTLPAVIELLESDIEDDVKFAKFVIKVCRKPNSKFASVYRSFHKFQDLCIAFNYFNQKRQIKGSCPMTDC